MKKIRMIQIGLFVLVNFCGATYADNFEIKLGSGDAFEVQDSSGTSLMDVLSSGNVGIGTMSPDYKLDVVGDINFTGSLYQNGTIYGGGGSSAWTTSGPDVYYNGGNVGIGTASPVATLDVVGSGGIQWSSGDHSVGFGTPWGETGIAFNGAQTGSYSRFDIKNNPNATTDNRFISLFYNADGENNGLVIRKGGNVGIGTTTPERVLHLRRLNPHLVIESDTRRWDLWAYSVDGSFRIRDQTAGGLDRMTFLSNGNVGIGKDPVCKLDVAGDVCSNGIALTSDVRYKKDIAPIKRALEKVNSLQGVSFNWRVNEFEDRNFSDKQNIGIIAQEVEMVVPEVVLTNQDGYKSVEYSKLVPLLIEAIKEQQEEIEQLKVRLLKVEGSENVW